jgi:cell wall-associated NlpC family hydrolase
MTHLDRRLVPARPDLAAEHLRGQVEAGRFVPGTARRVIETAAPLRREPNPEASLDTEALFGELVTVYDELEGWAWGQLARDSYVGWLPANALGAIIPSTHRVSAVRTFIYPTPSIRRPPLMALSMGSEVAVTHADGLFEALEGGGFVFARHLAPLDSIESDPVAVAEQFLGTPYLWGGKTSLGLDCSALVQTALNACGLACPRDSDMQERELGRPVDPGPDLEGLARGDLLFWRGHVAMVRDATTLIHATGHTMTVAIEPLREGVARIAAAGDRLSSVRRIG